MNFAFLLVLFGVVFQVSGQKAQGVVQDVDGEILNFEKSEDLLKITASKSVFEPTNTISLLGKQSLRWDWRRGATLSLPLYNFYSERVRISPFDKDQCLVIWVFNDSPSSGAIILTLNGQDLPPISCKFYLDFTGWRTAHIPLSQMEGKVPQKGDFNSYQRLNVNVPQSHPEKGNFLTAVIEHGIKPVDERYIYAVLTGKDKRGFISQASRLLEHPELYYHIISHRNNLHALRDVRNQTETYICYEAQDMIPHASLHQVSDPCLIIFKDLDKTTQSVSVALPDLHQDAFSREQKHKQWISRRHELRLTFDGDWNLNENSENIKVQFDNGRTIICVEAQHGVSYHFTIQKATRSIN